MRDGPLRRLVALFTLAVALAWGSSIPAGAQLAAVEVRANPSDVVGSVEANPGAGLFTLPVGNFTVNRPMVLTSRHRLRGQGREQTNLVMAPGFAGPCIVAGIDPRGFDASKRCPPCLVPGVGRAYDTGATAMLSFPNVGPSGARLTLTIALHEPGGIAPGPILAIGSADATPFTLYAKATNQLRVMFRCDTPAEYWPGSPWRYCDFNVPPGFDLNVLRFTLDLQDDRWAAWAGSTQIGSGATATWGGALSAPGPGSRFKTSPYPLLIGGDGNCAVRSGNPLVARRVHGLAMLSTIGFVADPKTGAPTHPNGTPAVDASDLVSLDASTLLTLPNWPLIGARLVPYLCGDWSYQYGYFLDADSQVSPAPAMSIQMGGGVMDTDIRIGELGITSKFGASGDRRGVGIASGPVVDLRVEGVAIGGLYDGLQTLSVGAQWYHAYRDVSIQDGGASFIDAIVRLEGCHFRRRFGAAIRSTGTRLVARGLTIDGSPAPYAGPLVDVREGNYSHGTDLGDLYLDAEGTGGADYFASAENHLYTPTFFKVGGMLGTSAKATVLLRSGPGRKAALATIRPDSRLSAEPLIAQDGDPAGWSLVPSTGGNAP